MTQEETQERTPVRYDEPVRVQQQDPEMILIYAANARLAIQMLDKVEPPVLLALEELSTTIVNHVWSEKHKRARYITTEHYLVEICLHGSQADVTVSLQPQFLESSERKPPTVTVTFECADDDPVEVDGAIARLRAFRRETKGRV